MQRASSHSLRRLAAWTLAELLVAMAASCVLCGGLITGSIALQKCFIASRHHIISQAQQMLLIDYMNLDLRRALTVSTQFGKLTVTIPDYYDSLDEPRDPQIQNGAIAYGPGPKQITYYKEGEIIYRQEGDTTIPLAANVSDFALTFLDQGQSIQVSVSFVPRYQFNSENRPNARDGTTTYTTTLLRNKRQS